MSTTLLRDAALLGAVCMGCAWYLNTKADDVEQTLATVETVEADAPARTSFPVQQGTGGSITLHKERGQFFTDGYAGSGRVRFLVDTGASAVALRLEDAEAAGFRAHQLDYSATVSTANGTTRAAPVILKTLTIGPITERNVRALVLEDGLEVSLLGMTFLERLQSFEARRDTLTLHM